MASCASSQDSVNRLAVPSAGTGTRTGTGRVEAKGSVPTVVSGTKLATCECPLSRSNVGHFIT